MLRRSSQPDQVREEPGRRGDARVRQLRQNFLTHLKSGVRWLTGSLEGVTLPETWNLRGILSVVFQLVGLTWANIAPTS